MKQDIRDAVEDHPDGVTIRFEVVPGSARLLLPSGFNPWRRSMEAKLTERAEHGRANRQLVEETARVLGISASQVEVMSGHKSSRKVLLARGLDVDRAVRMLYAGQGP
ncbi:MAG: hypothetical protein GKC10_00965 [Methanosarcinales archaeon]|nr:hypothetical protein [Methanosarcinales archaeon]